MPRGQNTGGNIVVIHVGAVTWDTFTIINFIFTMGKLHFSFIGFICAIAGMNNFDTVEQRRYGWIRAML